MFNATGHDEDEMKKIGIVGGVGWPSTVDYYRLICSGANAHFKSRGASLPYPTPPMAIESLVMSETRSWRAKPSDDDAAWARYDAAFRNALIRLQQAGCDFGIIANNTSHTRLHSIRKGLNLPIISILEETAIATCASGAVRGLVLGTDVTMRSDDYSAALLAKGVRSNDRLPSDVIDELQHVIDTEFDQGGSKAGRAKLLEICKTFVSDRKDTAVLLACTELPLAFPEHSDAAVFEADGFKFINPTAVHVQAALSLALGISQA